MFGVIISGKNDLSEVLVLIAFILFLISAILTFTSNRPFVLSKDFMPAGFACLALAWLVL